MTKHATIDSEDVQRLSELCEYFGLESNEQVMTVLIRGSYRLMCEQMSEQNVPVSPIQIHALLKVLGEQLHKGLASGHLRKEDIVPLALRDQQVYEQTVREAARKRKEHTEVPR